MSIYMSATSVPSGLAGLFNRERAGQAHSIDLTGRLEEPEATRNDRSNRAAAGGAPPAVPQVVEPDQTIKASRRRYTKEEKLRILRLVDAASERGQVGAILRREGIYYSTLRDFQQQRAKGRLGAGYERDKQTANAELAADKKRIAELEADNRQLKRKLDQAELIIDVQKKLSQLLGITLPQTEQESSPMRS
jgi:transposase